MKASEIDWSEAPEGATHYLPERECWVACWFKRVGDVWECQVVNRHGDVWEMAGDMDNAVKFLIQRHTAWNGTGLPPVGTVCEVNYPEWRRCEVFAHKVEGDSDPDVLFSYARDNGEPAWNWVRDPSRFRPIRTPEQIAAEERQKAIDEMARVAGAGALAGLSAFAAIYDAGYRKVEGDKQ